MTFEFQMASIKAQLNTNSPVDVEEPITLVHDATIDAAQTKETETQSQPGTTETRFKCDQCSLNFTSVTYLKNHMRRNHDCAEQRTLKCRLCKSTFQHMLAMNNHYQILDGEVICAGNKSGNVATPANQENPSECHMQKHAKRKPLACRLCTSTFRQVHNMRNHFQILNGKVICVGNKSGNFATPANRENPSECPLCTSHHIRAGDMENHLQRHIQGALKTFKCHMCLSKFSCKSDLNIHVQKHVDGTPLTCPLCQYNFLDQKQLIAHMKILDGTVTCDTVVRRANIEGKPNQCYFCPLAFSTKGLLSSHERVHTHPNLMK